MLTPGELDRVMKKARVEFFTVSSSSCTTSLLNTVLHSSQLFWVSSISVGSRGDGKKTHSSVSGQDLVSLVCAVCNIHASVLIHVVLPLT